MAKYILLFFQLNIILRNLPFFVVLGCITSVVFPIIYPSDGSFDQLKKLSAECMKQSKVKAFDSSFRATSKECLERAEAKVKNAAQVQKK
jgi:hypothetical protein